MDDANKREQAQQIYTKLCAVLDAREWKYQREDAEYRLDFGVKGNDLVMPMRLSVDAERQLVRLMSPLPFKVPTQKRLDITLAVTAVNCNLAAGNFDFDGEDGTLGFRIASCYIESEIGDAALDGMLRAALETIDAYNDRFQGIVEGTLSLEQFFSDLL